MLTNLGLAEFSEHLRDIKAGYVRGTIGQILSERILAEKLEQYPKEIQPYLDYIREHYMGKITVDCIDMIKAYIWQNDDKPGVYDPDNDVNADTMFMIARVKGSIDTMPDIRGICVRYPGHIGVYIGNGKVVEARGTMYGVVETNLKERGWTHWLECPYITYLEGARDVMKRGDTGEDVKLLQEELNVFGANLTTDGSFGPLTETAVKAFQTNNDLEVDGIVNDITLHTLTFRLLEKIKVIDQELQTLKSQMLKLKKSYVEFGSLFN